MTANKKKKQRVRERMARTGESYQTAHRALDAEAATSPALVIEYLSHVIPFDRPLTVGRHMSCELVIDDGLASRKHATFTLENGAPWIEDHESRNGVLVNGRKVEQRMALAAGDVVVIGKSQLRVAHRSADGTLSPAKVVQATAWKLADPPEIGSTLAGRYRLKRVVSSGKQTPTASPCIIYEAENVLLGGGTTVQLLARSDVATAPWLKAWLLYEARALRRAAHPQVLEVFDVSETADGNTYVVCAPMPELTLERWLDERTLSTEVVHDLARQLAELLEHLHAKGVFHGALLLGSVHVEGHADRPRVKLCSLWCARIADQQRTPARPGEPADARGDLRAFGMLVSALLAKANTPLPALEALCRDLGAENPPARCRDAAAVRAAVA